MYPNRVDLMDKSAYAIMPLEADVSALKATTFANYILPSSHNLTLDIMTAQTAKRLKGRAGTGLVLSTAAIGGLWLFSASPSRPRWIRTPSKSQATVRKQPPVRTLPRSFLTRRWLNVTANLQGPGAQDRDRHEAPLVQRARVH